MAAVYSSRIASGTGLAAGDHVVYTVPTGYTLVIRDISLWQTAATSAIAYVANPDASAVAVSPSLAQYGVFHWEGRAVFNAGDTVSVDVFAGSWTYSLSGYLLSNP